MSDLNSFHTLSFVQQISLLDQIETGKDVEAIPELLELYQNPLGDDGVDQAVSDTLRALLTHSPDAVAQGLESGHERTVKLCAHIAGKQRLEATVGRLAQLAEHEQEPEILMELLSALARVGAEEHLHVFRRHLHHPDPLVAAQCIETLGGYRDGAVRSELFAIIDAGEADDRFRDCDISTSNAVAAVAALGEGQDIAYLVSKIHHRNPTARRLILERLVEFGAATVPYLEPLFHQEDVDEKIMAANVLGLIRDKKGADILVSALDRGQAQHPNVRYAIYEALGKIPSLKGLICLVDGLHEPDEMLLMPVVISLEPQINPGLVGKIKHIVQEDAQHGSRILRAVVAAKATALFEVLYGEEAIAAEMVEAVAQTRDPETLALFAGTLRSIGGSRAEADAERLQNISVASGGARILAADDSKSMRMFYKAVGSGMNYQVETAEDGRQALEVIESGELFDLIITDLNMPVMDGIQLTEQIRANLFSGTVPILMVTTESEGSQVELAKKTGVTDFIQKPLTPATLGSKIQELLGSR